MTIESICDKITSLINTVRKPLTAIPAALLVCGAIKRPGLSATLIAANIIRRYAEAGIPTDSTLPDGSPSIARIMERIRIEEIVKAIKTDAKIEVGLPVGSIQIQGTGANAGGPVEILGFNINPVHGDGVVR